MTLTQTGLNMIMTEGEITKIISSNSALILSWAVSWPTLTANNNDTSL